MDIEKMKIINTIQGYSHSYIVYSAVELGIFNALFSKSLTNLQLATELHLSPLLLERFMKVLVAMDFVYQENGQYSLTSIGGKLSNDSEESLAAMVLFNGRICMKAWGYFYEGLKNNISPIELMEGEAFFETNEISQNRLLIFNEMMRQSSSQLNLELLFQTRKVADIKRIVDIGGGAGDVITQLLQGFPLAEGIVLDKDYIKAEAEETIRISCLQKRCQFIEGDFFLPLEHKADMYVLSRILHDWDDRQATAILSNIAAVMANDNVLLIIEKILPEKVSRQALPAFLGDMHIWTLCNGQERTESEFERLLRQVNLYIARKHFTDSDIVILEVKKDEQPTNRGKDYEIFGAL